MTTQLYPTTRDFQIAALYTDLSRLERRRTTFYSDPMTESCGCTDDFAIDFDKKERGSYWASSSVVRNPSTTLSPGSTRWTGSNSGCPDSPLR